MTISLKNTQLRATNSRLCFSFQLNVCLIENTQNSIRPKTLVDVKVYYRENW
jgi:hypothetical protein